MKLWSFAVGLAAFSLSGCSAEQSEAGSDVAKVWEPVNAPIDHQLVNALVDTFDVPSCLNAQLRYAGRKNIEQSIFHQRRFDVPDQCVRDLMNAAERLEFTQSPSGEWSGTIIDGTAERLKFYSDADPMPGNLLWEVDVT